MITPTSTSPTISQHWVSSTLAVPGKTNVFLGYILSPQPHGLSFAHPIQLLTLYAKLCKLSSSLIDTRPPTIVQLLWHHSHPLPSLIALGSSIGGQGGPISLTHPEAVRRSKASLLDSLWTHALQHPSPLQRMQSDDVHSTPWERSKWGHCAETVPFAACVPFLPLQALRRRPNLVSQLRLQVP